MSQRKMERVTNSIHSNSTLSIHNIEFPPKYPPKCPPKGPPKSSSKARQKRKFSAKIENIKMEKTEKIETQHKKLKPTYSRRILQKTFHGKTADKFLLPETSLERLETIQKLLKKPIRRKPFIAKRIIGKKSIPDEVDLSDEVEISKNFKNKFLGKCTKDIQIKTNKKNNFFKFTLTEDPRESHCLTNPLFRENKLNDIDKHREIAKNVKNAKYVESTESSDDQNSSSICEEIDLENPFSLDFQGIDYKNTFREDEQTFQNAREYLKMKRYSDRRNTKIEVELEAKKEEIAKGFRIPEYFNIDIEYDSGGEKKFIPNEKPENKLENESIIEDKKLAKIYRTAEKPVNKFIIDLEIEQRKGRYFNLYEQEQKILKEKQIIEEEKKKNEEDKLGEGAIDKYINKKVVDIEELENSIPPERKKRIFPHNIEETLRYRHVMKKSKKIIHEESKLREDFYADLGKPIWLEAAHIDISDISMSQSTISEQSTDDADLLEIGLKSDKFQLRGFQCLFGGDKVHGKLTKRIQTRHLIKDCMTRSEWLKKIAPVKRNPFLFYNPSNVRTEQCPDDPKLALFQVKGLVPTQIDKSPIKEISCKPFGQQYKKLFVKQLHYKKPKTYKLKKFNLTGFIDRKPEIPKLQLVQPVDMGDLMEYAHKKLKLSMINERKKRRHFMHYLGIPFQKSKKKLIKKPCKCSSSGSSEWIPETMNVSDRNELSKLSTVLKRRSDDAHLQTKPLHWNTGNIPAPKFRESKSCKHSKIPQPIPSQQIVEDKTIPYLKAPGQEKQIYANLQMEKNRKYVHVLEARHHHDHLNATQHVDVITTYCPKYPDKKIEKKKITKDDDAKATNLKVQTFDKAIAPRLNLRDLDLSLPDYIQQEYDLRKSYQTETIANKKQLISESKYLIQQEIYKTIQNPPIDFLLRDKFVQLIQDMSAEIKRQLREAGQYDEPEEVIDKNAYLKQLNDELESIKDCLSSLDSSICTNFTNDSGSFLLMQDKKLPMDYVRKSSVPFKKINHVKVVAKPIPQKSVDLHPYKTCPFSGQLHEQSKTNDKFHTFRTRIKDDTRGRLHVPVENIRDKMLGATNQKKYNPQVATDIDDIYISTLNDNRPPVKKFKPRTVVPLINSALRKKFVSWFVQQKLSADQHAQAVELNYYSKIIKMNKMLIQLFMEWEKKNYEQSMNAISQIKSFYVKSDILKCAMRKLEHNQLILNMEIVYTEDVWMHLIMLQNFHYLIKEKSWRSQNDWIHKKSDGTLESYYESIQKRYTVNIRPKDRDDAWTIKNFYDNVYLPNQHPIEIVFHNAQEFNEGVNELRRKNFVCLVELHYTFTILDTLKSVYNKILKYAGDYLEQLMQIVYRKSLKNIFMKDREVNLMQNSLNLTQIPLEKSLRSNVLIKCAAYSECIYTNLVPKIIREAAKGDVGIIQKLALIFEAILDLLCRIDEIPRSQFESIECTYRKRLMHQSRKSKQALRIEGFITSYAKRITRLLAPPFKPKKREGKLKRLYLKGKPPAPEPIPKPISEKMKFLFYAFNYNSTPLPNSEKIILSTIDELADTTVEDEPRGIFHFDHFLRLNCYQASHNIKTQIEIRDGPEEKRFKCQKIVPDVLQRLEEWQKIKKLQKLKDIKDNPHLYDI